MGKTFGRQFYNSYKKPVNQKELHQLTDVYSNILKVTVDKIITYRIEF